jgi:hypothetical protein
MPGLTCESGGGGNVDLGAAVAHDLLVEDLLGRPRTRTAAGGNTELSAQLVQRVDAVSRGAADLFVGYRVADTDVHSESGSCSRV